MRRWEEERYLRITSEGRDKRRWHIAGEWKDCLKYFAMVFPWGILTLVLPILLLSYIGYTWSFILFFALGWPGFFAYLFLIDNLREKREKSKLFRQV